MKTISEATLNVAHSAVFLKKFEAQKSLEEAMYAQELCGGGMKSTIAYWMGEVNLYTKALDEIKAIWAAA